MRLIQITCLIWSCIVISAASLDNSICDINLDESKLDDNVKLKNSILDKGIIEFHVNATTLMECVSKCCEKINCNYAFLKEQHQCYLISCVEDATCQPISNPSKLDTEPVDYLVKIRSVAQSNQIIEELVSKERSELTKLEYDIFNNLEKSIECTPETSEKDCSPNEICTLKGDQTPSYECVCPKKNHYHRIDGVCREYLPKMEGCMLYLRECNKQLNEECVSLNEQSKHGTCQCQLGYRRNPQTFRCELVQDNNSQTSTTSKGNRRRPSPAVSPDEDKQQNELNPKYDYEESYDKSTSTSTNSDETEETLFESFMKKLGVNLDSAKKHDANKQHKTISTTSTTTTVRTTTTTTTDPPNIATSNLQANAGPEMHIYYPLRTCFLNGTLTKFVSNQPNSMIVKWIWIKSDSSPAFGRFVGTNEAPIVIYEQLVTGVYKFTLKVWTNTNEFSQSSVNVYVHPFLMDENRPANNEMIEQQKSTNDPTINKNIIEIELDLEPRRFTEYIKDQFLYKFQLLLQQHQRDFHLEQPKVVLVNSRIASPFSSGKSRIILEIIVTDIIDSKIVSVELPVSKLEDRVYYTNLNVIGPNRRVVTAASLVPKLRKNLKSFEKMLEKLDYVFAYLKISSNALKSANKHESLLENFDVKISSINVLTCTNDEIASTQRNKYYNCSNHGKCDTYSHKCVCDKFWMFNFYSYYLDYENDITNGNNCEFNIPLVIVVIILIISSILIVLNILVRYFFYYMCCCCCCRKSSDVKARGKYIRKLRDDSYLEDEDDQKSNSALLKSNGGKLLKKMKSSIPFGKNALNNRHKYALLNNNDENDSLLTNGSIKSVENSPMGTRLNYDDDDEDQEDVVYEEKLIKNGSLNMNKRDDVKKYNII